MFCHFFVRGQQLLKLIGLCAVTKPIHSPTAPLQQLTETVRCVNLEQKVLVKSTIYYMTARYYETITSSY